MIISKYIKYFVRMDSYNVSDEGNKVYININNNMITLFGHILLNKFKQLF
jgi:hypothetical protein